MTEEIEKGKVGALFEDFLREQETYEETTKLAVKRVLEFLTAQEEIKKCPKSENGQPV